MPSSAPRTSATTTMNSSKASLSLVPNRLTMASLAPGGWWSMMTWPTAATSEVAPGSTPASSSETPSATAVATSPATGARQSRPEETDAGRAGAREDRAVVLTRPSSAVGVTFACRHPGPRSTVAAIDLDGQAEGPAHDVGGDHVRQRTGRDRDPVGHHQGVREAGRDLLDVMRDEHDGRRPRLPGESGEVGDEGLAGAQVEAGRRLVEQEEVRVRHQGAGDRCPPPLARGQRAVRVVRHPLEPHPGNEFPGPLPILV